MNKVILSVLFAVGLSVASWAGDYGIGGSLGNTNYATEYPSATISSNRFGLSVEGILPVAPSWEVDPYISIFNRTDDGEWATDLANYKTSEFGFGARAYYVTKITEQFRLLAGGDLGLYFGENKWDDQGGSDKYTTVVIKLPLAAEYRIVPAFALRVSASLAGFSYQQETYDYDSYDVKQNTTNFYLINKDATVSFGAYYFF